MEVRFCHNCGKQLKAGAKFCSGCGTPVLQLPEKEPEPVIEEVVVTPVVPAEPTPVVEEVITESPAAEEVAVEAPAAEPVAEEVAEEVPAEVPAEPEAAVEEVSAVLDAPAEPVPAVEEVAPVAPTAEEVVVEAPAAATEEAPAPVPAPAKKDPYPRRSAGRTILAILLCLFIFLWSLTAMLLYNVRSATSGEQLGKNLESVLEDTDLVNLPASQLIGNVEDSDVTIVEWVIQEISANYDGKVVASEKDIEKFLEESTISDFVVAKLELYLNDVYSGSDNFEITVDEIEELLEDNADLMEDVFGTPLSRKQINSFIAELEDREILENLEVSTLKEEMAPVYYGVQIGLSYWVIGFFGVLALLFVLWLAGNNKWNMLRTCGDAGITWTVLGSLLCLPGLATLVVPNIWSDLLKGIPFVDSLISTVSINGLIPAAILLGVGILLIVIKAIGKALVLKSAMKKQV